MVGVYGLDLRSKLHLASFILHLPSFCSEQLSALREVLTFNSTSLFGRNNLTGHLSKSFHGGLRSFFALGPLKRDTEEALASVMAVEADWWNRGTLEGVKMECEGLKRG